MDSNKWAQRLNNVPNSRQLEVAKSGIKTQADSRTPLPPLAPSSPASPSVADDRVLL